MPTAIFQHLNRYTPRFSIYSKISDFVLSVLVYFFASNHILCHIYIYNIHNIGCVATFFTTLRPRWNSGGLPDWNISLILHCVLNRKGLWNLLDLIHQQYNFDPTFLQKSFWCNIFAKMCRNHPLCGCWLLSCNCRNESVGNNEKYIECTAQSPLNSTQKFLAQSQAKK